MIHIVVILSWIFLIRNQIGAVNPKTTFLNFQFLYFIFDSIKLVLDICLIQFLNL